MSNKRFNPANLDKLNNPSRLEALPLEYIIKKTGITQPGVIIDLGAGTGLFSAAFAAKFQSCTVYAADISEIMVDWIKENRTKKYPNIIPLLMDDSTLDLHDNSCDFLYMINLHHELDNPLKTVRETYRLLKPGGIIAISDWKKEETGMGPDISIRVSPGEIERQLSESGFSNSNISNDLQFNYFVVAEK
jgi:ubiquinone/menaquinone biosynthesis C-methylase UbiE